MDAAAELRAEMERVHRALGPAAEGLEVPARGGGSAVTSVALNV